MKATTNATMTSPEPTASPLQGWLAFAGCCAIWGSTFLVISIGNQTGPPDVGGGDPSRARERDPRPARLRHRKRASARGCAGRGGAFRVPQLRDQLLPALLGRGVRTFGNHGGGLRHYPAHDGAVRPGVRARAAQPAQGRRCGCRVRWGRGDLLGAGGRERASAADARGRDVGDLCLAFEHLPQARAPPAPIGANAIACLVGLPVCLAGSFIAGERHVFPTTLAAWFPIAYLTLVGSVGAFVLYTWLISRWSVTRASFIAVVFPSSR